MTTDDGVRTVSGPAACELARITYRQLDYWCRAGLVFPRITSRRSGVLTTVRGSGTSRRFTVDDVRLLALYRQLDIAPGLRHVVAGEIVRRGGLGSARWVVVTGNWSVRVCDTVDDVAASLHAGNPSTVIVLEDFDE